jgi:hypothetical protein
MNWWVASSYIVKHSRRARGVKQSASSLHGDGATVPAGLADHLVGLEEEGWGNRQAQRLGGLEVDDELERRGLLERQVGEVGAIQDLVYSRGRAAIVRGNG